MHYMHYSAFKYVFVNAWSTRSASMRREGVLNFTSAQSAKKTTPVRRRPPKALPHRLRVVSARALRTKYAV